MRWDDHFHSSRLRGVANPLRIVSCVSDKCAPLSVLKERLCLGHFVSLTRRQLKVERTSFRVDYRVNFGGESTT